MVMANYPGHSQFPLAPGSCRDAARQMRSGFWTKWAMMSLRKSSLSLPSPLNLIPLNDDQPAKRRCCEGFPSSPSRRARKARAIPSCPGVYRYQHPRGEPSRTHIPRYHYSLPCTNRPNLRNTRSCIMDAMSGPSGLRLHFATPGSPADGRPHHPPSGFQANIHTTGLS